MTRKDYILIARAIRRVLSDVATDNERAAIEREAIGEVAKELAYELKHDNGRFDRTKFLNAAMGEMSHTP
jgi:hypothetical protein